MIRFVEQHEDYSVYKRRRDGSEVYLAHGFPRVYLVEFDSDWVIDQWNARKALPYSGVNFLDWLRERLLDPDMVDELEFCVNCGDPTHTDDGSTVEGDDFACDTCVSDEYHDCADCEKIVRSTTETLNGDEMCSRCLRRNYSWCEECDGYYNDEYSDDHDHDSEGGCGCESPQARFAVRNDGEGMLWNDHQVTVSLPAGTIDDEGINRIKQYLESERMSTAASLVDALDPLWQTKQGNFTKRLSRTIYKHHGGKIAPAVLSQVGCIARDHSTSIDFAIATTRDLNMSAEDFYHEESCWWGSYYEGRCALKTNGGFGLRSFNINEEVTGRAWVMPLKLNPTRPPIDNLRPTFNTATPDAFVVFNGYGELEGYNPARIISHMAGMTYRKVNFRCDPMFVNGDTGYLIAPEEIATHYTDGSLYLSVNQHSSLFQNDGISVRELVNA